MNQRIPFILEKDRFPLSKMDWFFLVFIFILVTALAIWASIYLKEIWSKIAALVFSILLCLSIYRGYLSSLYFKKINTGFTKEQNQKLIVYCMSKMNFKLFTDKEYRNVFVCFIHQKYKNDRQEIYLIAKEKYILINSDREKDSSEGDGRIDFVDRIGMQIYKTAIDFRRKYKVDLK